MSKEKFNPFRDLEKSLRDVPPEMKKKVMNDVAIAKFIMDMAFLVTLNYSSIIKQVFKARENHN